MNEFLKAIYDERLQMSNEQLLQVASLNGIDLRSSAYRVLIVSCAQEIDGPDSYQRYCVNMPQRCRRFVAGNNLRAVVSTDFAGKCTILIMDELPKRVIAQKAGALLNYLDARGAEDACVAIGRQVNAAEDIPLSYKTAFNALNYRALYAGERCLFCEDMQAMLNLSTLQSTVDPNRMLQAFRERDMEELRILVTAYAERVRAMSGESVEGAHPTSIRRMFVELTVYVLHMASDMGVRVEEILQGVDPYNYLLMERMSTPIIIDWFMDMCVKLRKAIDDKMKNKEHTAIQKICAYIDEHLSDCTLSLEDVAASAGITPSYLSKLFHKEMALGFSKYVAQQRIDHAKHLLLTTSIPLKDIAEQSGFASPNYFGTVFKRSTGLSPNQYRLGGAKGEESGK